LKAIILLNRREHGSASFEQQERLLELVSNHLKNEQETYKVISATLDYGNTALPDILQRCAENGANAIAVLPVYIPGDDHLQKWIAKIMLRWHTDWKGAPLVLQLLPSPDSGTAWSEAVISTLQGSLEKTPNLLDNPPAHWENDPQAWSHIPPHRYHLLTCRGPRCTAKGAAQIWAHLAQRLKQENLIELEGGTLTVSTGCLFPCNHGPVLVIHPDNIWYSVPSIEAADEIVTQHIINGCPVKKYQIPS
jgi:(2Fe-2S) ferredoxin